MKPLCRFRNGSRDDSQVHPGWKTATPLVHRNKQDTATPQSLRVGMNSSAWAMQNVYSGMEIYSEIVIKSAQWSPCSLSSSSVVEFTFCVVFVQTIIFSCISQHPPNPPSRLRTATPRIFHLNQSRNISNRWWNRPPTSPPLAFIDPAVRPSVSARCFRGLRAAQKQATAALTPLKRTPILLLRVVTC